MIVDFVSHHFLSSVNEDLNIDWSKSGIKIDSPIMINGNEIKPYEVALRVVDTWLEGIKEISKKNIEGNANQKIFDVAFGRISKKLFPTLVTYILPSIKYDGKDIIKGKDITPSAFWSEAWPKLWDEISGVEKALLKKFTILNDETTYEEVMNGFADALNQQSYSGYKNVIGDEANKFYDMMGHTFSEIFGGKKVSLSNKMISELFSDLNRRLSGEKIDFKPGKGSDFSGGVDSSKNYNLEGNAKRSFDGIVRDIENFSQQLGDKKDNEIPQIPNNPSEKQWSEWAKSLSQDQRKSILRAIEGASK